MSVSQTNRARFEQLLKSNYIIIAVAVVALLISFAIFYGLGSHNNTKTSQTKKCEFAACVAVNKNQKESQVFTVKSGEYVQFNNADGGKHNLELVHSGVQHEDASRYQSGDFGAAEAWKVQFKQDGSYVFEDKYNQNIEISVIVYTPGKDYKIKNS